jgi:c-di-GMP-binding flagellar brake protein YcgR
MGETSALRRKFPRIPSSLAILVRKLGQDEIEGFVKTRIVGLGGCMFGCDEALGVDSYVDLLISLKHDVIKARGKVVYENPTDTDTEYEVGIEFVEISDESRKLLQELFEVHGEEG